MRKCWGFFVYRLSVSNSDLTRNAAAVAPVGCDPSMELGLGVPNQTGRLVPGE
ncbi:hypothetical protein MCERE19_03042 [Spirosomataceae bacterium]|jgi:hypothetical protein